MFIICKVVPVSRVIDKRIINIFHVKVPVSISNAEVSIIKAVGKLLMESIKLHFDVRVGHVILCNMLDSCVSYGDARLREQPIAHIRTDAMRYSNPSREFAAAFACRGVFTDKVPDRVPKVKVQKFRNVWCFPCHHLVSSSSVRATWDEVT